MQINSRYDDHDETPSIRTIDSNNRVKCPYCKDKFKKGDKSVELIFNAGPTGTVFICLLHAHELKNSLDKIL
jgi:hypothetical protein